VVSSPKQSYSGHCGGQKGIWDETPSLSREDTIFLIDWDDTLLASSWLAAQGLRLDSVEIPHDVVLQLQALEKSITKLLTRAINSSCRVWIVTNAEHGWVELSAMKFLPSVSKLLHKVEIMSARSTFQNQFQNKPDMWKVNAYSHIFQQTFHRKLESGFNGLFNVLSLGDSNFERNAVLHLSSSVKGVLAKSVKFVERPSMQQLMRQLEIVYENLDQVVSSPETIDLMLTIEYL